MALSLLPSGANLESHHRRVPDRLDVQVPAESHHTFLSEALERRSSSDPEGPTPPPIKIRMLASCACRRRESAICVRLVARDGRNRLSVVQIRRSATRTRPTRLTSQLPMRCHGLHRTQNDLELWFDVNLRTETRVDCCKAVSAASMVPSRRCWTHRRGLALQSSNTR